MIQCPGNVVLGGRAIHFILFGFNRLIHIVVHSCLVNFIIFVWGVALTPVNDGAVRKTVRVFRRTKRVPHFAHFGNIGPVKLPIWTLQRVSTDVARHKFQPRPE